MEYNTSDFRKGLKVIIDNEPYLMNECEFTKPGKGQAVYKCKFKHLLRGTVLERTYRSGDSLEGADVTECEMQYLYNDGTSWYMMNTETFEQFGLTEDQMGDAVQWMLDQTVCKVMLWNGAPISVEPPNHMVFTVEYCEPGFRGNTATNVSKAAKLDSGAEIQVPAFIEIGDQIKVDTRTSAYIERVKKA